MAEVMFAGTRIVTVVAFYGGEAATPNNQSLDRSLRESLQVASNEDIQFFSEYIDFARFHGVDQPQRLATFLGERYAGKKIDLIFSAGPQALGFLTKFRREIFPGVPVIFLEVRQATLDTLKIPQDFVGVASEIEAEPVVKLALRLRPASRELVLVSGTAELDRIWEARLQSAATALAPNLPVRSLSNLAIDDVERDLAALTPSSLVIGAPFRRDGSGRYFPGAISVLGRLNAVTGAPIFHAIQGAVGLGAVGSAGIPPEASAQQAASIAKAILAGAPPAAVPLPNALPWRSYVDWRELRRWKIDEALVPSDAVVLFREPSYVRWIVAGAVIVALQAALIGALLFQRARRRRAERDALGLGGRLLTAHEDERRHLARELHDDLTQRLARLAIDAGSLERSAGVPAAAMRTELVRLSEDVHALSYRLHPSMLDDLGLADALAAECDRVARHGDMRVDVQTRDIPESLSSAASLCLFRVAQEALNNAVRHAQASAVTVLLSPRGHGIELAVSDNGQGFDPERTRDHPSLGLASMRERVRIVRGELDIESTLGRGTTVVAWVPA